MFAPFDEEKAYGILNNVINLIENGSITIEQVTRQSEERKGAGLMLGAMVAADDEGNEHNLVTVSGISRTLCTTNYTNQETFNFTFVPPVVSAEQIDHALALNDERIHKLTALINECESKEECTSYIEERKTLTTLSLERVHDLYSFHNISGDVLSLKEICKKSIGNKLPPTGTGDCTAPKLLDYAFKNKLHPVSMCEIFYGDSFSKENLQRYGPCDERCGILLPWMLGLKILYRDKDIIVVDKQSGILSVPGRGPEKQDCIESRFKKLFAFDSVPAQPAVHRLDMETSGIMILAFNKEAHKLLNKQFENKEIQKEYIALLDGVLAKKGIPQTGCMELFFRLDPDNRPHQIWDDVYGKSAVTEWQILDVEKYKAPDGTVKNVTRVLFKPHTGRTHQLRVASSDNHGFGIPIIGDTLYGKCMEGERLMLHARRINFTHPITGQAMEFICEPPF